MVLKSRWICRNVTSGSKAIIWCEHSDPITILIVNKVDSINIVIGNDRSGSVDLTSTLFGICLSLVLGLFIGLATLAVSDSSSRGLRMLLDGEFGEWLPTLAGVATFFSLMVLLGSASYSLLSAVVIVLNARRLSISVGAELYLLDGL